MTTNNKKNNKTINNKNNKNKIEKYEVIVPDTSIIIEGIISRELKTKKIFFGKIIIHEAVIAELEHQANQHKAKGYLGIEELKRISELKETYNYTIEYEGLRPNIHQIQNAKIGDIDAMIRQLAYEEDAYFLTADKVQAEVARAKGMKVKYYKQEEKKKKLKIESFFDENTMSVHLRENTYPTAKKGKPGSWVFEILSKKKLTSDMIKEYSNEIIEEAEHVKDAFVEIDRLGSTIVQFQNYRIVITRPPFSDGWEITAVRPVKKLSLEDYNISEKLLKRLDEQAEGILIAGSPGMGKSTFSQALAEFYSKKGKIVKTIEAPRDLILPEEITQYAISHGSFDEIHDILLLSRPDYTLFDEMRNTKDFQLFSDLRLSGIGLAGVVHATNPIDAIQRFVGRIELGVIPQVVDTVIFIKNGAPEKILSLKMTVKVPAGMTEEDLARPVVVVSDFKTGEDEYELYSYGEETVVVPVKEVEKEKSPHLKLAEKTVEDYFKNIEKKAKVIMNSERKATVYVPERSISKIIGKQGSHINKIEKELGLSIDVKSLEEQPKESKNIFLNENYDITFSKNHIKIKFDKENSHKQADIYLDGDYLMTVQIGKNGEVQLSKKNKLGKLIEKAYKEKGKLEIIVKE